MIILANKEIYRLDIKIGVSGDNETKSKLTATEKMADQTKKKMQTLDKIKVNPSARLDDKVSSTIDKINSKHRDLNRAVANPTARLNDQASSKIKSINSSIKKLENTNATATIKLKNQNLDHQNKVQSKTNKLKSSNVNPTARNATSGMETNFGNTKKELNDLDGEFRSTSVSITKSLDTVRNKTKEVDKSVSNNLNKTGETVSKVGDKISKVGDKLTTNVSLPIVGMGVASAKFSMDFGKGMAKISTVADTSKTSLETLGEGIINLSNMSGEGFETIQDGMYDSISSGVAAENSVNFLTTAVKAAKGGFTDTTTSVDGLTTVLNAYGLKTEEATNIANQMFIAQNLGKTTFGEMSSSIGNVIPTTAALKVGTSELFSSLATLTANGIKTSEAVTGLKATYSNIAKPSDEASKMAKKLGLSLNAAHLQSVGWGNFLKEVKEKTNGNTEQLYKLFGSVEAVNTVLTMTSDQGMGLFEQSMGQMTTNTTALDDAFNKVNDTAGSKLQRNFNELKNASIKLGDSLAPVIKEVTDVIGALASKLEGMDENTLKNITSAGLFVAALGPAVKIIGALTKGIGGIINIGSKIAPIFGKTAVAESVLAEGATVAAGTAETVGLASATAASGLGELAVGVEATGVAAGILPALFTPVGLAVAAVGLTAGLVAYRLSQDVVPSVDLFADGVELSSNRVTDVLGNTVDGLNSTTIKISDATKKSVGAYMEMDNKVQKSLLNMKFTNATITSDIAKDLTTTFSTMGQTINTELDKDLSDSSTKIQKMLSSSKLNGSDQTDMLAQIQNHYNNQKATTKTATEEINSIIANANQNNRSITADEYAKIDELRTQMTTTAVTSLSDNEKESAVILGRIKNQSTRLTAETAGEVVKQLEDQRMKTIDSANIEYAERVKIAEAIRSEGGEKATQTADKIIEEAGRQRDEVIKSANDTKTQGIDVLKQSYTGLGTEISDQTGKILSGWDKLKAWWGSNNFGTKTATIDVNQNLSTGGNGSNIYGTSSFTPTGDVQKYNYPDTSKNMSSGGGYASGTLNASYGIHPVAENGFEIIVGRQNKLFNGGEKVLNNEQSKSLLQRNNAPTQSNQGQYQLAQPQMQVAGIGGVSVGDIQVTVNGNQDTDGIVQDVVQVVGYKLKEALTNIKK